MERSVCLVQFLGALAELLIDGRKLFVCGLEFLVHGLQLFIR